MNCSYQNQSKTNAKPIGKHCQNGMILYAGWIGELKCEVDKILKIQ